MHNNTGYRILSKKFGQITVNGPNQAKNDFLVFFVCSPANVCYEEAGYQFSLERTGAMLFIDVTTETKNLSHQKK